MTRLDFDRVTTLVVHHTASDRDVGGKEIRQWHLNRGFSDIGYHYVIRKDGTLEYGRSIMFEGAHVRGHNDYTIGVVLVGDFTKEKPSAEQRATLVNLHESLFLVMPKMERMIRHKDLAATECPGFDLND